MVSDVMAERALDVEIATALGWTHIQTGYPPEILWGISPASSVYYRSTATVPAIQDDLPAAIAQCESDGLYWRLERYARERYDADVMPWTDYENAVNPDGYWPHQGSSQSPARALWRAWLAWKQAQREEEMHP